MAEQEIADAEHVKCSGPVEIDFEDDGLYLSAADHAESDSDSTSKDSSCRPGRERASDVAHEVHQDEALAGVMPGEIGTPQAEEAGGDDDTPAVPPAQAPAAVPSEVPPAALGAKTPTSGPSADRADPSDPDGPAKVRGGIHVPPHCEGEQAGVCVSGF